MKNLSRVIIFAFAFGLILLFGLEGYAGEKLMLYSSLKEKQLDAIKKGFTKANPDIDFDYYSAGSQKVITKIATEVQAGKIGADVIIVGEPDYYNELKSKGMLLAYNSPEAKKVPAQIRDAEGYYTGIRASLMVIGYNPNLLKGDDIPKDWSDLLNPKFKGWIGLADPTLSGTALYTVAGLIQNYKWEYFEKLKANGGVVAAGSSDIVQKIASGDLKAGIVVDYLARTAAGQGSPVKYVFPKSGVVMVAGPVGILKATKSEKAAKKFVDYILSLEGQKELAKADVLPARPEVKMEGVPSISEVAKTALSVNDKNLMIEKAAMLDKFSKLMRSK